MEIWLDARVWYGHFYLLILCGDRYEKSVLVTINHFGVIINILFVR